MPKRIRNPFHENLVRPLLMKSEIPELRGYSLCFCNAQGNPESFAPNPERCLPQENLVFPNVEELFIYYDKLRSAGLLPVEVQWRKSEWLTKTPP